MSPDCPICGNTLAVITTGTTGHWTHYRYECTACSTFLYKTAPTALEATR